MMKKLLIAFLSISTLASAQNTYRSYFKDATTYREHSLDITRMKVDVSFDTQKSLVKGKVTHSFIVLQKQVDSVFFDAPGINIKSALIGSQNLPFNITDKGVWVKPSKPLQWDQTNTITFEYEATPRKGLYFIGWNVPENPAKNPFAVRKQIWTQGQGVDNRYWIPMYDDMNDKFITETVVTFENGYEVLSNGTLLKKTANKNNTTTWHYSMTKPHAGYLLMLGIGKYNIKKTKSARGIPMNLYYYPEFADRAEPTYRYSEMMVDFLEQETGINYPWESYSQIMVQDFLYGAMENTTATIFGDFFNVDERAYLDRNYVGVNCHELTHQWFGDYITARDWRDTWLQESYATYYPKMLTKKLFGDDAYNWQRRGEQNSAIEATKRDKYPIRHTSAGSARNYPKGSNVISMLSYVLGEEQWKRALNHYLKTHAYGNVETNDLQQAIQDKLGIDMSWFFDQWILRGGEPQYTVHYEDLMGKDGSRHTEIAIEQTHQRDEVIGFFKMPIAFEVHYTDGSFERVVDIIQQQFEVVKIPNKDKKEIAFVLFDPNSMVMKTVNFKKSYNELKAQVIHAPNMLDRYDALVALKDYDVAQKRELLMEVFRNEKFHAMKSEVITQLINDEVTNYQLLSVFNEKEPQAKLTFIKAYNGNNTFCVSAIAKALTDNSYDVVQAAIEKICKIDAVNVKMYLPIVKEVYGINNSVNIKYHELSVIYNIDTDEHAKALINYASNQWEFRTRNNAFAAIKASGVYSAALIPHLFDAMLNTNSRLAGPAAELTNFLATKTTNLNDMQNYFNTVNYTKVQKDILIKYVPGLK
jgi:aminopeptidase N